MLFSSLEFILIFLPITGVLFALARRYAGAAAALGVMTTASLVFYAISSVSLQSHRMGGGLGDIGGVGQWIIAILHSYLMLLVASVVVNYLLALAIRPGTHAGRVAMGTGVIFNVALIFWFKYSFFVSSVAVQAGVIHQLLPRHALPLGISFFTFVQIAYLVDRYKGVAPVPTFGRYLLFVSFFPHLIAGPIVHHASMMPQLERPEVDGETFALALFVFIVGLTKKTLLADPLGSLADIGFQNAHGLATFNAWATVLAYTFQLYFDFSGYSDMAIGLALMFGVRFPWNFLSPYKSTSISQFWRNWHITLSNFLRDYVYIPMGGSRVGPARLAANLLITMLIGGIWHGAGWTFIAWGGLHGLALVVNHRWESWRAKLRIAVPSLVGWVATMAIVVAGWVLFRAQSFGDAKAIYASMFGRGAGRLQVNSVLVTTLPYILIGAFVALLMPNTRQLSKRFRPNLFWAVGAGALFSLGMIFILGKVRAPEFLYYDF